MGWNSWSNNNSNTGPDGLGLFGPKYPQTISLTSATSSSSSIHPFKQKMQCSVSLPKWRVNTRANDFSTSLSAYFSRRSLSYHVYGRSRVYTMSVCTLRCSVTKTNELSSPSEENLVREPHKYFDQVMITVHAGDGGHGAVLNMPNQKAAPKGKLEKDKARRKSAYKRGFDGSVILPSGGHGGDVVIYADESKDTLFEFHKKSRFTAKRGEYADVMGVLSSLIRDGLAAPTLRIPVPLGTVVKTKRGKTLADLANPGEEIIVARGGQGRISMLEVPEHKKKRTMSLTPNVMRDENDKVLVLGQPGEETSLQLILRVVADVGLVGLPNAGKSTLLASITLAKPDIADYPFTTLMPNLWHLDGDPGLGADRYSSEATLADLPGLIEGAHLGKGLGRNFLRHLRRTRLLVHVIDAASMDPVSDYRTIKEELRMYNPEYIFVLNKIDIPEAMYRLPSLTEEIRSIGIERATALPSLSTDVGQSDSLPSEIADDSEQNRGIEDYPRPLAVVGVSVLKGHKVDELLAEIRAALRHCRNQDITAGT